MCREGINVRLNMKIGNLVMQHQKVCFEPTSGTPHSEYSTHSLNRLIGRRMNNSFGGNTKLLDLSVRTSVKTPGSRASMYSGRSKFVHASNPNPQIGTQVHPKFNKTMYDSFMGKDIGMGKRDKSAKNSERLPFPFVSGLLGGHDYTKPGKKVFFDKRLDNKEVLQYQLEQINYKGLKNKNDYDNERDQDKNLIKSIKDNISKEEFKRRKFNELFKTNYKMYNDNKLIENENSKRLFLEAKNAEKYNFFPFTHGDEIEKKRINQKNQLTEELRDKYSRVNSESSAREKALMGSSFTHGMYSTGGISPNQTLNSELLGMKSTNGRVPVKYISGYPSFLTPFKQYPYRRLNDTHVENTMQSAVKRYEEELMAKQQERMEDADRFK